LNLPAKPIIGSIILAMVILLGLIVFSDNGLMELNRLQAEHTRIAQQNDQLAKKNYHFYRIITRLKTDPLYIEHIARGELGLVGAHQMVFNVPTVQPRKSNQQSLKINIGQ
jgi:cell division protein FtsB